MLRLDVSLLDLPLNQIPRTTRGAANRLRTVVLRLRGNGVDAIGEAAPIKRYNETVDSVLAYYAAHAFTVEHVNDFDAILAGIPPGARCALDIALHDLLGKDLGCPLWRIFGVDPSRIPQTSFTVYIDDLTAMLRIVEAHREAPILKVKLGVGREIETIEAIRAIYRGTIRIDANEGWTPEQAVDLLRQMKRFDIEFCEQPIPAGSPEKLRWIRERAPMPIVADEDSRYAEDLYALVGCVDGINVKLAKCGGIRAAFRMIQMARVLGMKVMLGCMTESSILITAAGHLASLVDWVDLDGNLMVNDDPFRGMRHENGNLALPDESGIGIVESAVPV